MTREIVSDGKPGSQIWYWHVYTGPSGKSRQWLKHASLVSGNLGEMCAIEVPRSIFGTKIVYAVAYASKTAALLRLAEWIAEWSKADNFDPVETSF